MKICILNGSPKSNHHSITMYSAAYLANAFPEHTYIPIEIAHRIKKLQRDEEEYRKVIETIRSVDVVLWAFPIYKFWVPAQLVRFIELVSEHEDEPAFSGKYTTLLTTSIRCFDFTAHHYIYQVSADWGMKPVRGFSSEMNDIKNAAQREHLKKFFARFLWRIEKQMPEDGLAAPSIPSTNFLYEPGDVAECEKTPAKKVVLIADAQEQDHNLLRMIDTVKKRLPYPMEEIKLHTAMSTDAWCMGCVKCMVTGQCVQKDGFAEILRQLKESDIIVVATPLHNLGISSKMKMFLDRTIVFGHTPGLAARQPIVLQLVSGPLRQLPNTRQALVSCFKRLAASDVTVVTDEVASSEELTERLVGAVEEIVWTSDAGLYLPELFLEKGGHILLRDFMYKNRAILPHDHSHCVEMGLYKELQLDLGNELFNRLGVFLMHFPFVKNWLMKNSLKVLRKQMINAYPQTLPWE